MVTSLVDGSLSEGQSRSFYNPSRRSKLKSFEDMTHKTKLKCRSGDTVIVHIVNWKQEIWFFYKIKCHLTKGSKPFCIYWLQQRHVISDQSCSGNIKKMGSVCITSIQVCFHCIWLKVGLFLTGKSLLVLVKMLLDFSAITLTKACHLWSELFWKYKKNGQCLYYRNILFQLMYKICLTGFAHCCLRASLVVSTILVHGPSWSHSKIWLTKLSWSVVLGTQSLFIWILS
jgi:hypothetical protein